MRSFKVDADSHGRRADIFLAMMIPALSRASLKPFFEQNKIELRSRPAKPGDKLKAGDRLILTVDPLNNGSAVNTVIPVIYEDDTLAVLDKPRGVLTHSKGALNREPTVASFIRGKLKDPRLSGNRAGIVHRLDRDTSGVIITAKTKPAQQWLQKQFSTRKAVKHYLAIAEGAVSPKEALIDIPIERNPKKPQTFRTSPTGKKAQTKYTVKKIVEKAGRKITYLDVQPLTGRTHQIRVHLAAIGHPLVGDRLYGRGSGILHLHASSLEIRLPDGTQPVFSSKLPAEFKKFLN